MMNYGLITGASSGIGKAIALRMASKKIPLLLVGRQHSLIPIQEAIGQAGGVAEIFDADLVKHEHWKSELSKNIASKNGAQWSVVLAASILGSPREECELSNYNHVFNTNVVGNLAVLEACLPQMTQTQFGRIVFFAGGGAAYAYPEFPAYALSKVSTVRLTENLAAIYPPSTGLSFVCLAPGAVDTPMLAKVIAAGGEVKTKTNIEEPVNFVEEYCNSNSNILSGRYIHVRDNWKDYLSGSKQVIQDQFFLRRIQ
ncbi:MAG: hypothetical protein A3F67_03325 [Verrucomicrobia bacterium RIFCSPHIGHO2_12_FULL_41_10]|nr:MAG: hypothetical protein A3F67_03325 [Verrucomicrobia bacterium RIFCSPHIGHO2_12_FULL_41_10]HLB34839.1 SDR family oxidoreductase [Chthoniobacterales bacterium]